MRNIEFLSNIALETPGKQRLSAKGAGSREKRTRNQVQCYKVTLHAGRRARQCRARVATPARATVTADVICDLPSNPVTQGLQAPHEVAARLPAIVEALCWQGSDFVLCHVSCTPRKSSMSISCWIYVLL